MWVLGLVKFSWNHVLEISLFKCHDFVYLWNFFLVPLIIGNFLKIPSLKLQKKDLIKWSLKPSGMLSCKLFFQFLTHSLNRANLITFFMIKSFGYPKLPLTSNLLFRLLRKWVMGLTQSYKTGLWGDDCPPLIYTILASSLGDVRSPSSL